MDTRPRRKRLRRRKPSHKFTLTMNEVDHIMSARRCLERASYFFGLVGDAMPNGKGRWGNLYAHAVIDAGVGALEQAVEVLDPLARTFAKK